MTFVMFILFLIIMFVPTYIAYRRNLKRRFACIFINILVGWTVIGWLPLIAWACLTSAVEK